MSHPPDAPPADATLLLPDARVMTLRGEVAAAQLALDDRLLTLSGQGAPLKPPRWLGRAMAPPGPAIRVAVDAIAPGVPLRPVWLDPRQAIALAERGRAIGLVAAEHLANGASIAAQTGARTRDLVGLTMPGHDIVMVDGLPVEVGFGVRPEPACVPMLSAEIAAGHHTRLRARAEQDGYRLTDDPALVVSADGVPLTPHPDEGGQCYTLPPGTAAVSLASRHFVPAELAPACGDRRRLGIALHRVVLDRTPVPLDSPLLGEGFLPVEHDGAWRWTDGAATIAIPPGCASVTLHLHQDWARYWLPPPEPRPPPE